MMCSLATSGLSAREACAAEPPSASTMAANNRIAIVITESLKREYDSVMLKGYTTPRTPRGISSLAPPPPWHYVSTSLAIEFAADPSKAARFLPQDLEPDADGRCAVYFAEWQFATDDGEEYLDPVRSQYKETIFLIGARYRGEQVAYCPFIFVDQDVSLMRGLVQGWP